MAEPQELLDQLGVEVPSGLEALALELAGTNWFLLLQQEMQIELLTAMSKDGGAAVRTLIHELRPGQDQNVTLVLALDCGTVGVRIIDGGTAELVPVERRVVAVVVNVDPFADWPMFPFGAFDRRRGFPWTY